MSVVILTDSTCDLPLSYLKDNNIEFIGLPVLIQDKEYIDDLGETFTYKEFYSLLRNGEMSTTSQTNAYRFAEVFRRHAQQGNSVIYIGFSSALSGTFHSSCCAKEEVLEEYPSADITLIDTLAASSGQGLLVYYACEMLKQGKFKEEIIDWIENNKLKVSHVFTVDDLDHLKRGGRISSAAAFVGSLLNIKPLLYVNDEGKLVPFEKARGRKKAIRVLFDEMQKHIQNPEEQTIFIGHGDCREDAELLSRMIEENVSVKNIIICDVGPTIGTHTGPGILTLFFLGDTRTP